MRRRVLSCFDKHVLRKVAVSFDKLRTNGHFIEGLIMIGKKPFALSLSKGAPPTTRCIWPSNGFPGKSLRYVQAPAPCHPQFIDLDQIGRWE